MVASADLAGTVSGSGSADLATLLAQSLSPTDLAAIGPTIRSALGTGLGVVQGAMPAFELMSTIANGQTPDPQAVVLAMGSAVGLANPLAGAAIIAAGEIAQGASAATEALLKGLGLLSDTIKPIVYRGLIKAGDAVPNGPTSEKWIPWSSFARGYASSANGIPYEYVWQHMTNNAAPAAPDSFMMSQLLYAMMRDGEKPGQPGPAPKNEFERFFFELLKKDVEYWANANPYVPPRVLLSAAAGTWNASHSASSSTTYKPPPGKFTTDVVPFILSASGSADGSGLEGKPLFVNLGPSTLPHPTTAAEALNSAAIAQRAAAVAAATTAARIATQKSIAAAARRPVVAGASPWTLILIGAAGVGALLLFGKRGR